MKFEDYPASQVRNAMAQDRNEFGELESQILNFVAFQKAWDEITSWPDYKATPLVPLPAMARRLGLNAVLQKDEGKRFHLKSFKALGGAYAVLALLQRDLRDKFGLEGVTSDQLQAGGSYRSDRRHHCCHCHGWKPWPLGRLGGSDVRVPVQDLPA